MIDSSYRYIILSAGQEWNLYSWESTKNDSNIEFYNELFRPLLLKKFWWRTYFKSKFLCRIIWFPYFRRLLKIDKRKTILIVYDWHYLTMSSYIVQSFKRMYNNLTIVYCFTNLSKVTGAKTFGLLDNLKDSYDQVYAFDKLDSERYGFDYSRLVYAPVRHDYLINCVQELDLFYVGQAKDRLTQLIDIFKNAQKAGLKCKFFITGVSEESQYVHPDIVYNQNISYGEVLGYISKSRCIVDAIQGESTGMTIKTCEAVYWDKKLITTNVNVVNEPYFNSNNIMVYDEKSDLKRFMKLELMPYTDKDRFIFSPYRRIQQIMTL